MEVLREPIIAVIASTFLRESENVQTLLLNPTIEREYDMLYEIILKLTNGTIEKIRNYYETNIPRQTEATFKSHFRMKKSTFVIICNLIGHSQHFNKRDENLGGRSQCCPEKALLIFLWTLATPDSYRSIAERFDVAKSTVYHCLNTVTAVILNDLTHFFIKWPTDEEKMLISNGFERYGLPNVLGAVDGCHIPIKKPTENAIDFFNRKKFYSVILQGICRHDMLFIDCDIRWPGSVHDGRVLRTSDMYPIAQQLCGPHHYLIGDSAYPVKNWLISPYRNNGHLTPPQRYFNQMLSKTRVIIENAFCLLKGRFRRLKDKLDRNHQERIIQTIMAACVLHNVCLLQGDEDIEQYINEGRDHQVIPMIEGYEYNENDNAGIVRRTMLTELIWNNRGNNNHQ